MQQIRYIHHKNREVLIVDFSDARGNAMIEIIDAAKQSILSEGKHVRVLNIFNNKTYLSPAFMRHLEKEVKEVDGLIDRQSIVGLSKTQEWILKGLNLWYEPKIIMFDSFDNALEFLVNDDKHVARDDELQ